MATFFAPGQLMKQRLFGWAALALMTMIGLTARAAPMVAAPPPAEAPAEIQCEPSPLDLGRIATGSFKRGVARLTNVGDTPRTFLGCKSSKSGTPPRYPVGTVLQPGESMNLELSMAAGEKSRSLTSTFTIEFSDHPRIRLAVKAEAFAYVLTTPEILDPETHREGLISLRATDDQPFKITSMYPPLIESFPDEAKVEHVVTIDWKNFGTAGYRQRKLMFRLDHPQCSRVTVMLSPAALKLADPSRKTETPAPPEVAPPLPDAPPDKEGGP